MLHEITLDLLEFSILVSSGAVIYPEPVEARGYLASFLVEINNPAVELHNLNEEIHIVWGRGPLSSNQKLGGGLGTRVTITNPLQDPDLARTIVPVADVSSGGSCRCHSGGQHSV